MSTPATGLWVRSDPLPDGTYGVTVTLGEDRAFTLDHEDAYDYAALCHYVATAAEHGVAVIQFFLEAGISMEEASEFLSRHLACAADPQSGIPFQYIGAIARVKHPHPDAGRRFPIVKISCEGTDFGYMKPEELREHGGAVLSCLAAAELDRRLLTALTNVVGLDEHEARTAIASLSLGETSGASS